jgi:hypothetical protein
MAGHRRGPVSLIASAFSIFSLGNYPLDTDMCICLGHPAVRVGSNKLGVEVKILPFEEGYSTTVIIEEKARSLPGTG